MKLQSPNDPLGKEKHKDQRFDTEKKLLLETMHNQQGGYFYLELSQDRME